MGRRNPSVHRCQVNNIVLWLGYGSGHAPGDVCNIKIECPKLVENMLMSRIVFSFQLLYALLHCHWAQFDNATI